MFEHKSERLLPREVFLGRLARHGVIALAVVCGALAVGVLGYHFLDGLPWVDSVLNASMILGGMGPVDPLRSDAAKLFAAFYALFSGLMFVAIAGILFAPVIHRSLHRFHLEMEDEN